jgi:CRISPR-associated protein Cmr6
MTRRSQETARRDPASNLRYPLPPRTVDAWRTHRAQKPQNPGLIFDRFAPDWGDMDKVRFDGRIATPKELGLREVMRAAQSADETLLRALNDRWEQVAAAAQAEPFTLFTDWRFLTGLGQKGPLEVGFTFDRYGFPVVPGSSVKGLARASALYKIAEAVDESTLMALVDPKQDDGPLASFDRRLLSAPEDITSAVAELLPAVTEDAKKLIHHFRCIFGTTAAAGRAIFLDAIPTALPRLELDIMNPHFPDYYRDTTGKTAPTDWQSPNPVHFLTVGRGNEFRFAVGWRGPLDAQARELRNLARQWLIDGLKDLGAGAKTSAGYGYFSATRVRALERAQSREPVRSRGPAGPARGREERRPSPAPPVQTGPRMAQLRESRQQQRPAPPPRPNAEQATSAPEVVVWRTARVLQPMRGWGSKIADIETGEQMSITQQMRVDKTWTPKINEVIEYAVEEQDGQRRVVRVRRRQ